MKKKIVIGIAAVCLAVGMVFAFTACGVNGSPESVVKASLEATLNLDVDKMLDTYYFEDEADKESVKAFLEEELKGEAYEVSGKITKFDFTEEEATDDELKAAQALYEGINIEALSNYSVTYSIKATVKITVDGASTETDASVEDETASGTVYKIDGKWYGEIVPAGSADIV